MRDGKKNVITENEKQGEEIMLASWDI